MLTLSSTIKQYWHFDHHAGGTDDGEVQQLWLMLFDSHTYQRCQHSAACFANHLLVACSKSGSQE